MVRQGRALSASPPIQGPAGDARGGADVRRQGLNVMGRPAWGGVLSGGVVSDGGHCPITGGVGLTEPIGSPKAGPGLQQVWLRGDRSCSLSVEVASVEAVATTGGGGEEVSTRGAAHFPLHAAGRSGWACAGATVEDAYVRVARAKAA